MKKYLIDFAKGILAGLSIALGGLLNILAKTLLNPVNTELAKIVGSLLFPIGLTLVCFCAMNLFTGKIGYLFDNKKDYLGFLGIIYLGNIVGTLIAGFIALAIFNSIDSVYSIALGIAKTKTSCFGDFGSIIKMFAGSILCGTLVYIAVLFYKTFKNKALKVVGIFIPIALFVYLGFDHCVANMFYFTFSLSFGNWYSYLNIAIATIGNSIGAILLNFLFNFVKKQKNT